jgi:3-hydroxyacyl-[acyl-carrier-protein] dehydratase
VAGKSIREIRATLPHRYPFALVDRIIEIADDKKSAVGIKCVSANEPFFQGHFPDLPIMPGVLILEALAQCAGAALLTDLEAEGKLAMLAGIDAARFRRPVVPGDQLRLEVKLAKMRGPLGKVEARATVDGQLAAECEITFAIADKKAVGR